MTVEMIFVGTELLLGNIVNTNGQFLSEQCAAIGLPVYYQTVVGDNEERLSAVIETAFSRSDVVLLCGGLGPTEDDLTKEVCARTMGIPLTEHPEARAELDAFMSRLNVVITENNYKQAMAPVGAVYADQLPDEKKAGDGRGGKGVENDGDENEAGSGEGGRKSVAADRCLLLRNPNGTAPGLLMEKNGKTAILLPGPPNEMKPMFLDQVKPYLVKKSGQVFLSAVVKICGVGESSVETRVLDLVDSQTNPTIATYAKTGEVHIRVTASGKTGEEAQKLIKPCVKELKKRFGDDVYTAKPEVSLEMAVVKLLNKYGLTITTAESCTGGMVAARLVGVPGVSDVFSEGFVTYSNKAKRKFLDVSKTTLKKYTAVSAETAKEMAIGGVLANDSDICVSVTGLAGPDWATPEIPLGRVYIGCCLKGKTVVKEYNFTGSREKIREMAASAALDLARRCILEQCKGK